MGNKCYFVVCNVFVEVSNAQAILCGSAVGKRERERERSFGERLQVACTSSAQRSFSPDVADV